MKNGIKPEDDEIFAAMNRLVAACTSFSRGETIPYSLMEAEFHVAKDTGNWRYLCRKFTRRFLKVRGVKLWAIENVGYRLCTQEEQAIENMQRRGRRAKRQLSRAVEETEAGAFDELSATMQKARVFGLDAARQRKRDLARDIRDQQAATRKSDTLPLRPIPQMAAS